MMNPSVDRAHSTSARRRSGDRTTPVGNWWAGVTTYPLGKRRQLWIGILVPNDDLLEGITQLRLHILAATIVTLLAALAYSFLLARSYSRPLEALASVGRSCRNEARRKGLPRTSLCFLSKLHQRQSLNSILLGFPSILRGPIRKIRHPRRP